VLPACVSVAGMIAIHKKIVVDERGKPQSVLIPWEEFCELSEALGLDLDRRAKADLRATRRDLKRRKTTAFKTLSEL
jgi:PHD/YefM family antitoxin component YafN of YafNO toxin-antitoxin module